MKGYDYKKMMEWLSFLLRCPLCGHKYNLENTKILESEQDEVHGDAHILIHTDCNKCKSSVMFNVELKGPEVYSVGMITDLTGQDSAKFKIKQPITTDEVIDIHKSLKRFNGDFVKALVIPK